MANSQRSAAIAHLRDPHTEPVESKSAGIVDALNLADQIAKTEALHAEQEANAEYGGALPPDEVAKALDEPLGKPVFNSHSQAFLGRLMAEERSLKETAANLRSQIDELEAQYTDVMLAESGVSAAIDAIKRGQQ